MNKKPQQVLQEAREEFDKECSDHFRCQICHSYHDHEKIKSFLTSTLQSFIEAEITVLQKERSDWLAIPSADDIEKIDERAYVAGLDFGISHLKEFLVTLKR